MVLGGVFFDLDDTLVLTSDADAQGLKAVARLCQDLFIQVETKQLLQSWRVRFLNSPWDPAGQVPIEEWRGRLWQYSLAEQGVATAALLGPQLQHCFNSQRLASFQLQPGVRAVLRTLQHARIPVGIITNGHAEVQRAKLAKIAAASLFGSNILVGGEEVAAGRREKPDKGIFLAACKLARCQPGEAIFVGDNLDVDIQGAHNADFLAAVWVNRHGRQAHPDGPQPTHSIASIQELSLVLEDLGLRSSSDFGSRGSADIPRPLSEDLPPHKRRSMQLDRHSGSPFAHCAASFGSSPAGSPHSRSFSLEGRDAAARAVTGRLQAVAGEQPLAAGEQQAAGEGAEAMLDQRSV